MSSQAAKADQPTMTFAPVDHLVAGVGLAVKEEALMGNDKGISRHRLGGGILIAVLVLGGVSLSWLVLMPRTIRRHRDLMLRRGPFKKFLTRYNDMTRKISGTKRSSWGLLTHVGRRSGRTYQTSLGTYTYGDGFLLPLGYGTQTDWYQNLMAAGTCELAWKGHTYHLERPELISGPDVSRAWPVGERILLQLAGMHDFVWLHQSREQDSCNGSSR
jgi:deazaflavin-dependent oxidoreductase (nitroreductase family)